MTVGVTGVAGGIELEIELEIAVTEVVADVVAVVDGDAGNACPDAGETGVTPLPFAPNLNRIPIPNRATVAPLPA